MKIIEELESLQDGDNTPLFAGHTGLKDARGNHLHEFKAVLAALDALQLKYPNHRLLIGNTGEWEGSEFALFGERDEDEHERKARLVKERKSQELAEAAKQKKIEILKKQAAKLGLEVR
jgi:hypothetical protein